MPFDITIGTLSMSAMLEGFDEADSLRVSPVQIISRNKAVLASSPPKGQKRITLRGVIHDSNFFAARATFNKIRRRLDAEKQISLGGRTLSVRVSSAAMQFLQSRAMSSIGYGIGLVSDESYWRQNEVTITKTGLTAAAGTFSVHNTAGAFSWAKIQFLSTGSTAQVVQVNHDTEQRVLRYTTTLDIGNLVTVDGENSSVVSGGLNAIKGFSGDFMPILVGTNQFSIAVTFINISNGKIDLKLLYTRRWE